MAFKYEAIFKENKDFNMYHFPNAFKIDSHQLIFLCVLTAFIYVHINMYGDFTLLI